MYFYHQYRKLPVTIHKYSYCTVHQNSCSYVLRPDTEDKTRLLPVILLVSLRHIRFDPRQKKRRQGFHNVCYIIGVLRTGKSLAKPSRANLNARRVDAQQFSILYSRAMNAGWGGCKKVVYQDSRSRESDVCMPANMHVCGVVYTTITPVGYVVYVGVPATT